MTHLLLALTSGLTLMLTVVPNPPATQPSPPPTLLALQQENAALRARLAQLDAELHRLREDNRQLSVLAGLTPPKDAAEAQAAKVVTQTDPVTEQKTLSFQFDRLAVVRGSRSQHWMRLAYVQPADGSPPRQLDLHILARLTQGDYGQLDQARLIVDGESVAVAVKDYQRQMRGGGGPDGRSVWDEQLTVAVPLDVLARLAAARDVQLRLRHVQLKLSPQQIAQFTAFQQRLNPAAPL